LRLATEVEFGGWFLIGEVVGVSPGTMISPKVISIHGPGNIRLLVFTLHLFDRSWLFSGRVTYLIHSLAATIQHHPSLYSTVSR
jgi:hypothetical protein